MFIMFLRDKIVLISLPGCKQQGTKKRTKETHESPLFTMLCTTRFARAYEKVESFVYACITRERERESIQIFGTTKYLRNFFSIFFCKEPQPATIASTPILYKV